MGGSSLCPEVLSETFGQLPGGPRLHVLDSTDPTQVALVESRVDLSRAIVIVASKSGSTLEPNIFQAYFFPAGWRRRVGAAQAGQAVRALSPIPDRGSRPVARA
jgi:glucose-6-phosphate isomerase